jgi:hypothetical protein
MDNEMMRPVNTCAVILAGLSISLGLFGCQQDQTPLSISRVSTDRLEFEPQKGEDVTVRYRVSATADVTVRFIDPFGEVVRTFQETVSETSDLITTWDGRDDSGNVVPPEAYIYTISASRSSDEVTLDPSQRTGGEPVSAHSNVFNQKSGQIEYVLPQPSRVRLILSQKGTGWPITTLLDWEPRAAGKQQELWDGWDADKVVDAGKMPNVEPVMYAFSLPENVVIVKGDKSPTEQAQIVAGATEVAYGIEGQANSGSVHQHALHARQRCFNPRIELSFLGAQTDDGVTQIKESTTLRIDVASEQPFGRAMPIQRATVFIFVDGVLVERNTDGYLPYHWRLNPKILGSGEHIVTGLIGWRDDHFGIRHARLKVRTEIPKTPTESH